MKKLILFYIITLAIYHGSDAQQIVKDKYKQRQMESMVLTRWGKFIPKWYYILFHNKYRKGEDRRNMLQLIPTVAATSVTEAQSEQEQEDTDLIFRQYIAINTSRSIQPVYHLQFKSKFEHVNAEIDLLLIKAQQIHVDAGVLHIFQQEQNRLNGAIEILREGFLQQGESNEGYTEIEAELRKLNSMIKKYIRQQEILNKYTKP